MYVHVTIFRYLFCIDITAFCHISYALNVLCTTPCSRLKLTLTLNVLIDAFCICKALLDGFWLVGRGVHSMLDDELIALNSCPCFYLDMYQIYFERFSRYLYPVYICAGHTFTHVHTHIHTYLYIYTYIYTCIYYFNYSV